MSRLAGVVGTYTYVCIYSKYSGTGTGICTESTGDTASIVQLGRYSNLVEGTVLYSNTRGVLEIFKVLAMQNNGTPLYYIASTFKKYHHTTLRVS